MSLIILAIIAIVVIIGLAKGFREVSFSAHRWQGLSFSADLFDHVVVAGFVTARWSKRRLLDVVQQLRDELRAFRGGEKG